MSKDLVWHLEYNSGSLSANTWHEKTEYGVKVCLRNKLYYNLYYKLKEKRAFHCLTRSYTYPVIYAYRTILFDPTSTFFSSSLEIILMIIPYIVGPLHNIAIV